MGLLSKILFGNKYNINPIVIREAQATAEDFNELKTVVNACVDDLNWIKSDEFEIGAGTTTVSFNDAFPDGVAVAVAILICNNANGYFVANKVTNPTREGFDITVSQAASGMYLAIRKR